VCVCCPADLVLTRSVASGALVRADDVDEGRSAHSLERSAVTGVQLCAVKGGELGGGVSGGEEGGGDCGGVRAAVDDAGDDRVEQLVAFTAGLWADEHGHRVVADVFGDLKVGTSVVDDSVLAGHIEVTQATGHRANVESEARVAHVSGGDQVLAAIAGEFVTTVSVQSLPQGAGGVGGVCGANGGDVESLVNTVSSGAAVQCAVGLRVTVVVQAVGVTAHLILAVVVVMIILALSLNFIMILSDFAILVLPTLFGVTDASVKVVGLAVAWAHQVTGSLNLNLEDVGDISDTSGVSAALHT